MPRKTRAARKKLALAIADGPPPKEEPEECRIEANTAAMKRISAFAKNAAAKTDTKNKEMLAEHNTQIEEMKGRLAAVEKTQRWVEEMAADLGVRMETVAAAIDGDGSAKKQLLMAAAAAYRMEHETDPEAEDTDDDGEDADEDVDDEYDKATDAIIRDMKRDNHVETQQNARDIQALAVGHNELVRKVEGHREEVDKFFAEFEKTQRWVKEVAAEVGLPMETVAAAIDGDSSAKKQFFMAVAAYQMDPARPRALEAEDADDGEDLNDEEGPKLRPLEELEADVLAISEFGAAAKERTDALSAQNKKELESQMDIEAMKENMSAHEELHRERRLKVMVCILICALFGMAVAYYRK